MDKDDSSTSEDNGKLSMFGSLREGLLVSFSLDLNFVGPNAYFSRGGSRSRAGLIKVQAGMEIMAGKMKRRAGQRDRRKNSPTAL